MAAAAVVIGIVAILGVITFNNSKIDPKKNSHAWVEKNVKKVSTDKIDAFVKLAEAEKIYDGTVAKGKSDDVKELMKDVPENEIRDFLKDTEALTDDEGILMN